MSTTVADSKGKMAKFIHTMIRVLDVERSIKFQCSSLKILRSKAHIGSQPGEDCIARNGQHVLDVNNRIDHRLWVPPI